MDLTDHALSNTVSALKQGSRVSLQHESRAVQGLLLVLRRQLALYSTTISEDEKLLADCAFANDMKDATIPDPGGQSEHAPDCDLQTSLVRIRLSEKRILHSLIGYYSAFAQRIDVPPLDHNCAATLATDRELLQKIRGIWRSL
eukprot:m.429215 g.429215  ORF g.429215 m.429215 type:complete len:144 (+) comp56714_c0_seq26:1243-1674(+)